MRTLARSRDQQSIEQAVSGLTDLKQRIPTAVEVISELAFALLELTEVTGDFNHCRRAVEELAGFEERQKGFYSRDVEVLCRWGRLWKDFGDQALENQTVGAPQDQPPAEPPSTPTPPAPWPCQLPPAQWYRVSATYYRRAYEASGDYYPGINLATLAFLISASDSASTAESASGGNAEYLELAEKIKKELAENLGDRKRRREEWESQHPAGTARGEPPPEPDDAHWQLASLGEACLLLGKDEAYGYYKQAWTHKNAVKDGTPHARDSIRKQAERIIAHQKKSKAFGHLVALHQQLDELFKSA